MLTTFQRATLAAALLAAPLAAQSFNLLALEGTVRPSDTYGAATGQAGYWDGLPAAFGSAQPLRDLAGQTGPARAFFHGCDYDNCTPPSLGYGPDVDALFGTAANADCGHGTFGLELWDLLPGRYELTVYGSPCSPQQKSVVAKLSDFSFTQVLSVAGTYQGSFASMQLGRATFDLNPGVVVLVSGSGHALYTALQLRRIDGPPAIYCSAKTNGLGCLPEIGATGALSATALAGFVVDCANVRNHKAGLLTYTVGGERAHLPFQGGTLCLGPSGILRTPAQSSGGTAPPTQDCSGRYALDVNAFARGLAGGNPSPALSVAGTQFHAQFWGRDPGFPAPNNTMLSDALEAFVQP